MLRNHLILFSLGTALIVVIVPFLAHVLELDDRIYYGGFVTDYLFELVLMILVPFVLIFHWISVPTLAAPRNTIQVDALPLFVFQILILLWSALFLISGGLTYRIDDVYEGVSARGPLLTALQSLTNSIICLAVIVWLVPNKSQIQKVMSIVAWSLLVTVIAASSSRGILLTILLSTYIASRINRSIASGGEGNHLYKISIMKDLLRPQAIAAVLTMISVFAIWGSVRDQYGDVYFSSLFRLAEPYWNIAQQSYAVYGPQLNILEDALMRIVTIPARWVGVQYDFSIEGQEVILANYMGIRFQEGVSLPVTIVGEGMLFAGPFGSALFWLLSLIMILACQKMIERLPYIYSEHMYAIIGIFSSKVLFAYARSLSGVFLISFYETLRDFLLIFILTFFCSHVSRMRAKQYVG